MEMALNQSNTLEFCLMCLFLQSLMNDQSDI